MKIEIINPDLTRLILTQEEVRSFSVTDLIRTIAENIDYPICGNVETHWMDISINDKWYCVKTIIYMSQRPDDWENKE